MKKERVLKIVMLLAMLFSFVVPAKVNAQAATVKLSATKKTVYVGNRVTLKLKNAKKTVTWTSSNKKVALVNKNTGEIIGVKAGKATITATCNGKKYTCAVTVKKCSLNKKAVELVVGETFELKGRGVILQKFSTDDGYVALVSSTGVITAKNPGETVIRVNCLDGSTYNCTVTVVEKKADNNSGQTADDSKDKADGTGTKDDGKNNSDIGKNDNTAKIDSTQGNFLKFSAVDQNGKTIDNSVFADYKLTLVNCWAYWCGPCVRELPELQELYEDYKDRGFNVIGVYEDDVDYSKATIKEKGVKFSCIYSEDIFWEYSLGYVPFSYFVDSYGNIIRPEYEAYGIEYNKTSNSSTIYSGAKEYSKWKDYISDYLSK